MILTVTLNTSVDKLYLMDAVMPETVMRVRRVNNTAGGKGLNVSRIAAQLGEEVTAMGFVGGHNGAYFESLITQPKIHKAFTVTAGETRCCINAWDQQAGKSTEYLEPGAPVELEAVERFYADFARVLSAAQVVTISGSVPAGVPADCYPKLIEACHAQGKTVLLDASGALLRGAIAAKPDMIKPNTDELEQLMGRRPAGFDDVLQAAKELHASGIPYVVVSLGAEGALCVCDQGIWKAAPPSLTPRNTVGCGDSMIGGFAVGFRRGLCIEENLRSAVAVSAANTLSMSTGSFEQADLEAILPKVTVQRLQ